uniref:Uncharacterized protein n=1 Tax=Hyaloperonospora arabidopsidis (strain Emoy2) TaxID=559515 RepID=M4C240_HYAAE
MKGLLSLLNEHGSGASTQKVGYPLEIGLIRSKGDDSSLWKMQVLNGSNTGHLPCTKVEQLKHCQRHGVSLEHRKFMKRF